MPDQRKLPAIAGAMRTNGARTTAGIRAERHHRLGEDDADLVGFGEAGDFAVGRGADDRQRAAGARRRLRAEARAIITDAASRHTTAARRSSAS